MVTILLHISFQLLFIGDVFKIFSVLQQIKFPQNVKINIYTRKTFENREEGMTGIWTLFTYRLN